MPFYYENQNESEFVVDSANIGNRAWYLTDGTVLNEYQLRADGGCGLYGEGVYPPYAIKELKNWINKDPIVTDIILENMLDDFWHVTGELPACQRLIAIDKHSYEFAYSMACQSANSIAKENIIIHWIVFKTDILQ